MSTSYLGQVLIVGAGGFVGSALRFVVSGWAQRLAGTGGFPFGTLLVNVVGCLLIGLLAGLADYRQVFDPWQRMFLLIGVLGGFTTFSTFAYESLALMEDADMAKAAVNVLLQVVLGFGAAYVGLISARYLSG